jgi:hypothetical protein
MQLYFNAIREQCRVYRQARRNYRTTSKASLRGRDAVLIGSEAEISTSSEEHRDVGDQALTIGG